MIIGNRAKEVEFASIKANITTRDEDSIISSLEKELAKMSNKCMKAENEVKKKEVTFSKNNLTLPQNCSRCFEPIPSNNIASLHGLISFLFALKFTGGISSNPERDQSPPSAIEIRDQKLIK